MQLRFFIPGERFFLPFMTSQRDLLTDRRQLSCACFLHDWITSLQGKFKPFCKYAKSFNSDDFDYEELDRSDYVFMRWKVSWPQADPVCSFHLPEPPLLTAPLSSGCKRNSSWSQTTPSKTSAEPPLLASITSVSRSPQLRSRGTTTTGAQNGKLSSQSMSWKIPDVPLIVLFFFVVVAFCRYQSLILNNVRERSIPIYEFRWQRHTPKHLFKEGKVLAVPGLVIKMVTRGATSGCVTAGVQPFFFAVRESTWTQTLLAKLKTGLKGGRRERERRVERLRGLQELEAVEHIWKISRILLLKCCPVPFLPFFVCVCYVNNCEGQRSLVVRWVKFQFNYFLFNLCIPSYWIFFSVNLMPLK